MTIFKLIVGPNSPLNPGKAFLVEYYPNGLVFDPCVKLLISSSCLMNICQLITGISKNSTVPVSGVFTGFLIWRSYHDIDFLISSITFQFIQMKH